MSSPFSLSRPLVSAIDLLAALSGKPVPGLDAQAPVLLDCRFQLDDPEAGFLAWQQARLPGARYGHLERDFSGPIEPGRSGRHPLPEPAALMARLRSFGVGPDTPVVFYDASGGPFAARGWWLACHLGHPAAFVLDGGMEAWREAGGELETDPPGPPANPAPPWPERPPLLAAATVADVEAAMERAAKPEQATVGADLSANAPSHSNDSQEVRGRVRSHGGLLLVDARSPERFAGEQEPIDPVAGHIPGAVCLPHGGNLDARGRFLPAADLAARWQGRDVDAAICYCGSGVTAAHNVLAAVAAGIGRPRLYVGSWSEWITDPTRPIAHGRS